MTFKEKYKELQLKFSERLGPFLRDSYIYIRNGVISFLRFLAKITNKFFGHIQQYWKGYLILICISFVVTTFVLVYHTSKIASQTIVVAESIKKIEEINHLYYIQSRQLLLHIMLDIKGNEKLSPIRFDEVPIFIGTLYNKYIQQSKFFIIIKNESPFHFEGTIHFTIGLNYYDNKKEIWLMKTTPYEIVRSLKLASHDGMSLDITNNLLNSGAFPPKVSNKEYIKIDLKTSFDEAYQPKVKITQRLTYF